MVGDYRLAGSQRESRRRGEIGTDRGDPDNALAPTHSGADTEPVFRRDVLQDLAELGTQALGRQARRLAEKLVEGGSLQRGDAQLGQYLLLADTLLQGALRQVRGVTLRFRLDDRLVAVIWGVHAPTRYFRYFSKA